MSFTVNFFKTKSRVNDLNKVLVPLGTLECAATGNINPYKLSLDIDYDAFNMDTNYAQIPIFNRFYFVKYEIIGNLVRSELKVDPLTSFKDDILNADIIAARSSNRYNPYFVDDAAINTKRIKIFVSKFPFEFDTSNAGNKYVITVGGK